MEAFGWNLKGVRGTWIDIGDNFNAFKSAVEAGSTLEQAAFQTFTGHRAAKCGFHDCPHCPE
jgi:hypothetical protein